MNSEPGCHLTCMSTQSLSRCGVAQQMIHHARQCIDIVWGHEHAIKARAHYLRRSRRTVCCDHGTPACHSLEQCVRKSFKTRGEHEEPGSSIVRSEIIDISEEGNCVWRQNISGQPFQRRFIGSLSDYG